jgi:hypothetical protein
MFVLQPILLVLHPAKLVLQPNLLILHPVLLVDDRMKDRQRAQEKYTV